MHHKNIFQADVFVDLNLDFSVTEGSYLGATQGQPVATSWCDATDDGGSCVAQKATGSTCGGDNECLSTHCADGYCCDTACGGSCEACALTNSEGTCTAHGAGTEPEGGCAPDVCGVGGVCRCADGQHNGTETDVDCGGGVCNTCPDGSDCSIDGDCTNGNCPSQDGVCCDTACDTQCEACLATKTGGTDGVCAAVTSGLELVSHLRLLPRLRWRRGLPGALRLLRR